MSRTDNVVKNISFGFIAKTVTLLLSFISRTFFIKFLGRELLGVSGLYSQVLQVLSFSELGFGTALNFKMYKPVANGDFEKTKSLLLFYKKVYRIIALAILTFGLLLIPFIHKLVVGANNLTLFELRLYYCFFLFNTVVSYFSTYKFSYINALQKNYIQTNVDLIFNSISTIFQICVIVITKNYIVYLATGSLFAIAYQIYVAVILKKNHPILSLKEVDNSVTISSEEKSEIYNEVKGLAIHQFSSIAIHSTDNIIISAFKNMGVLTVALVSNYNLIINGVINYVAIIFNSVTSGFGNLATSSNDEEFENVFKTSNFINFWIYGFCCIALYILTPPFISLWLGKDFLIDEISFGLIILNCYLQGQSTIYNNARIAKGNFQKDKWISFIQALLNLVVSIILAKKIGLVGVYIGTIVSRTFFVCFRPVITYKFLFGKSCKFYFSKFIIYFAAVLTACIITKSVSNCLLNDITILKFVASLPIVLIIPNLIFALLFFKSREFKDSLGRLKKITQYKLHAGD